VGNEKDLAIVSGGENEGKVGPHSRRHGKEKVRSKLIPVLTGSRKSLSRSNEGGGKKTLSSVKRAKMRRPKQKRRQANRPEAGRAGSIR